MGAPPLAASSAFDSPSSARNGRTVWYRVASAARIATAAESSASGTGETTSVAALITTARGATSSTARHNAAASRSAPCCSTSSCSSNSTFASRASVRDAFSSCGSVESRSLSVARFAVLISRVAISTENNSSASSIAFASRWRITAVNIAVRLGAAARSRLAALDPSPYRAIAASRFGGICDNFNRPSWNAPISSTRSNDRANAVPVVRVGGRRSRSSSEYRPPAGVTSVATSADNPRLLTFDQTAGPVPVACWDRWDE
ncbi:hypothetical protein SAMN02787118_11477 [Streptomyces mirabilis]|uniref:Uncharacterized protein n=1 Tax=Streptomyces mirabilis TaxID=68239 RepID=A0A1I2MXT4_9ACTN|nr:hypothetical protein [Streptomyces mirabilis]SFF96415.1 hypothetical protein SAMN02787118_11477 [Streptomyces mirabilis]